jgi:superfamily I DNA/RNA helicase
LITSGADPRRMMLLTFSRRAAAEMQRRVERITAQALGARAGPKPCWADDLGFRPAGQRDPARP